MGAGRSGALFFAAAQMDNGVDGHGRVFMIPEKDRQRCGKAEMPRSPKIDYDAYVPGNLVRVANRLTRGASQSYRKRFGIGVVEWRILNALAVWGPVSASQVGDITGMDKAPISRAIRKLAQAGYARADGAEGDQRRQLVTLTETGRALYDKLVPIALERERQLLEPLSDEDKATLRRLLLVLRDHVRTLDDT